ALTDVMSDLRRARSNTSRMLCDRTQNHLALTLATVSRRQRDELLFVAEDLVEAAELPIVLGFLDALPRRGDEVPPDVARAVHRRAAEEDPLGRRERLQRPRFSRTEDDQPAGFIPLAADLDRSFDQECAALLVVRVDR